MSTLTYKGVMLAAFREGDVSRPVFKVDDGVKYSVEPIRLLQTGLPRSDLTFALDAFYSLCTVPQTKAAQDAWRRAMAVIAATRRSARVLVPPATPTKETPMNTMTSTITPKGIAKLRKKAKAQKRLKNGRFARGSRK